MKKEAVKTQKAPAAIGPYSQAVRAGGLLFVSGQLPLDPVSGAMAAADVAGQTRKALENLGEILRAAGAEYGDVVKTTVFMTDLGRFAEMNGVYAEFFRDTPPARAAVQVVALPKGALVEIEALAALP